MAVGQAALEQQSQQPEQADPSAQLQYAQEQSSQAHEAQQNALDRQQEAMMADKQHQQTLIQTKADADHKIRVEKSKPKPKVVSGGRKP